MNYDYQNLIRSAANLSGVITESGTLNLKLNGLNEVSLTHVQSDVHTYSTLLINLKYHGLELAGDYQAAKSKLTELLNIRESLISSSTDIISRDEKIVENLKKLEEDVAAINSFTESVYYRVLNLSEKKKIIQKRNDTILNYFSALSGKLSTYQQDINSLLREYDIVVQNLNALATSTSRLSFTYSSERSKLNILYTQLNTLSLRFLNIETKVQVLVKRVLVLTSAVTETKNFYASSTAEHIQAVDGYNDLASLVFRLEYQFNSITAKLNTIRCNYNQFVNQDYLNQIEGKPYLDMEATIKKLINGFLILSGDNTTVVKDKDGIYTIHINWPAYPEREHYVVQLPKPQVIKYELPSNACPVTCGGCSGQCPVVKCNAPSSTTPTPTPTPTSTTPEPMCEFTLTDIETVNGDAGCDIECYVLGKKIGVFPAIKTNPPTSIKFTVPLGTTKEDFVFKNVNGSCQDRFTFELFLGSVLAGTFSVAYDPGDPAGTELVEKDRISCGKSCTILVKDLNANMIIDDDLDLYINGNFSVMFPGSVNPTTEYNVLVNDGNVLFEFKFKKSNGKNTKKEIEIYNGGTRIFQQVVTCYSTTVPGTVVSRFSVPVTCPSSSSLRALLNAEVADRLNAALTKFYQVEGHPVYEREALRLDLSFAFEYPYNHTFAEVYLSVSNGDESLAFNSNAELVPDLGQSFVRLDSNFNRQLVVPLSLDFYSRFKGYDLVVTVGDINQAQRFGLTSDKEAELTGRVYRYLIDYCTSFNPVLPPIYLTAEVSESEVTVDFIEKYPLAYLLLAFNSDKQTFIYSPVDRLFFPLLKYTNIDTKFCLVPHQKGIDYYSIAVPVTDYVSYRLVYLSQTDVSRIFDYLVCSNDYLYVYDLETVAQAVSLREFSQGVRQDYLVFALSLKLVSLHYEDSSKALQVATSVAPQDLGKQVDLYLFSKLNGQFVWFDPANYQFVPDDQPVKWKTQTLLGQTFEIPAYLVAKALSLVPSLYLGYGNAEANAYSSSALDLMYSESNSIELTDYRFQTGSPPFKIHSIEVLSSTNPLHFTIDFDQTVDFTGCDWVATEGHEISTYLLLKNQDQYYQVTDSVIELGNSWANLDLSNPIARLPCSQHLNVSYEFNDALKELLTKTYEVILAFSLDSLGLEDIVRNRRYTQTKFLSLSKCSALSGSFVSEELLAEDVFMWVDSKIWIDVSLVPRTHYFVFLELPDGLYTVGPGQSLLKDSFPSHTGPTALPLMDQDVVCHVYRSSFSIQSLLQLTCLGAPITINLRSKALISTAFTQEYSIVRDIYRTEILEIDRNIYGNQDFTYSYSELTDSAGSFIEMRLTLDSRVAQGTFIYPVLARPNDPYVFALDLGYSSKPNITAIHQNSLASFRVSLVPLSELRELQPLSFSYSTSPLILSIDPSIYLAVHENLMIGMYLSDVSIEEAVFRQRFLPAKQLQLAPAKEEQLTLFSLTGQATPLFRSTSPQRDALLCFEHYTTSLNEASPFLRYPHWYLAMAKAVTTEEQSRWIPCGEVLLAGMFDAIVSVKPGFSALYVQPENFLSLVKDKDLLSLKVDVAGQQQVKLKLLEIESVVVTYTNSAGQALFPLEPVASSGLHFELELMGTVLTGCIVQGQLDFNTPVIEWANKKIQSYQPTDFIQVGHQLSRTYEFPQSGYCEFYFKANRDCYVEISEEGISLIQANQSQYLHTGLHVKHAVMLLIKTDDLTDLEFTYYFTPPRLIVPGLPILLSHASVDFAALFKQQDTPYRIEIVPLSLAQGPGSEVTGVFKSQDVIEAVIDFKDSQVWQSNLYSTDCLVNFDIPPSTVIAVTQVIK